MPWQLRATLTAAITVGTLEAILRAMADTGAHTSRLARHHLRTRG